MESEVGELILEADAMGGLRILRADPRIKIVGEVLDEIRAAMALHREYSQASIRGNVIRIETGKRTVVYKLGDEVPGENAYYAEWPD